MITAIIIFIIACMASGFLAGLLGLGGGAVLVPLLLYIFPKIGIEHYVMQMSLGTSLACVFVNTLMSSREHKKHNGIDWNVVKGWQIFIIVGTLLGAYWASSAPEDILKIIYICVMLCIVLFRLYKPYKIIFSYKNINKSGVVFPIIIGGLSATMGIGAGNAVPIMALYGITMQKALASASVLGMRIAAAGVCIYIFTGISMDVNVPYALGFVYLPVFLITIPITLYLAPLGVRCAHKLSHIQLNFIFCMTALFLISYMAYGLAY